MRRTSSTRCTLSNSVVRIGSGFLVDARSRKSFSYEQYCRNIRATVLQNIFTYKFSFLINNSGAGSNRRVMIRQVTAAHRTIIEYSTSYRRPNVVILHIRPTYIVVVASIFHIFLFFRMFCFIARWCFIILVRSETERCCVQS